MVTSGARGEWPGRSPRGAGSVTCARTRLELRVAHGAERAPSGQARPLPSGPRRARRIVRALRSSESRGAPTEERVPRVASPIRAQPVPDAFETRNAVGHRRARIWGRPQARRRRSRRAPAGGGIPMERIRAARWRSAGSRCGGPGGHDGRIRTVARQASPPPARCAPALWDVASRGSPLCAGSRRDRTVRDIGLRGMTRDECFPFACRFSFSS
jgi:hypothetical protein